MNNNGQLDMELTPMGILGAILGAGLMYYMMGTTEVSWFFKLMGIPLGGIAGFAVASKIGNQ